MLPNIGNPLAILYVRAPDWHKKNRKGGLTMWLERFIGTCQKVWVWTKWEVVWPCSRECAENDDYKLLWYFSVRTDHEIGARRPDLERRETRAVRFQRMVGWEKTKMKKYQDLKVSVWKKKVILTVVGALGSLNTTEIEWQSESHSGRHSFWTDPKMWIIGNGKNP